MLDELQLTYTSYNEQNLNSPAVSVIRGSTVLLLLLLLLVVVVVVVVVAVLVVSCLVNEKHISIILHKIRNLAACCTVSPAKLLTTFRKSTKTAPTHYTRRLLGDFASYHSTQT
jgi:flagellar biosynthesis protein FlhB